MCLLAGLVNQIVNKEVKSIEEVRSEKHQHEIDLAKKRQNKKMESMTPEQREEYLIKRRADYHAKYKGSYRRKGER